MFNMFVVKVILAPCKSCSYFYLLIQNISVYMAVEVPCKQVAKLEKYLLDLNFL